MGDRIGEMTQKERDDAFRRGISNAPLWCTSGGDLLRAARAVWGKILPAFKQLTVDDADIEPVRHIGPFFLLCGFAIENYLKALIVKDTFGRQDGMPDPTAPTRLLDALDSHNLVTLAARGQFKCSEEEMTLLSYLTEFSEWAGRYPIPKRSANPLQRIIKEDDLKRVEDFVARVTEEYYRRPFRPFEKPQELH